MDVEQVSRKEGISTMPGLVEDYARNQEREPSRSADWRKEQSFANQNEASAYVARHKSEMDGAFYYRTPNASGQMLYGVVPDPRSLPDEYHTGLTPERRDKYVEHGRQLARDLSHGYHAGRISNLMAASPAALAAERSAIVASFERSPHGTELARLRGRMDAYNDVTRERPDLQESGRTAAIRPADIEAAQFGKHGQDQNYAQVRGYNNGMGVVHSRGSDLG